ncbi:Indoleamine 2,3-dioxygenase [Arthroderma uncinatum]|uniref:Indoleamine 2,3-dioxygenase n=1 Tax=Arthroderma uncinatum TaxID=74035 RepID=UPI00144ACB9A|nr:Indoleamine 2,3-dioxygenase [Arthroderma uncinatum]KAF3483103.1 Indoleamine 2,3-dioxygenase [Arthroderma uncinatum]
MAFYTRLRPFLAGTSKMEEFGLPDGLHYDDGSGNVDYRSYRGGSNAQSSLIQLIDIALGVHHRTRGDNMGHSRGHSPGAPPSFIEEMRAYMPGPHRRFLEAVSQVANVRPFVAERISDAKLQVAYSSCLGALYQLRDRHIRIVSRYIIVPSRMQACAARSPKPPNQLTSNLQRSVSTSSQPDMGPRGTGGTALIPFLKRTREETCEPLMEILVRHR